MTSLIMYSLFILRLWTPQAVIDVDDDGPLFKSCYEALVEVNANLHEMPSNTALEAALFGYWQLRCKGMLSDNEMLTVIDFSLPSTARRMWIFNLNTNQLLHHTHVAHGQGTGDNYAEHFSNSPQSHQSSLGFYRSAETYHGKHGLSLVLDGLEAGINDKARERYVVLHGADYVSEDFIAQHGRLGRSHGCPAIAKELAQDVIELIKEGSCIFIYHPSSEYTRQSQLSARNCGKG